MENGLQREVRHEGSPTLLEEMAAEILKKNLAGVEGWRNLCTRLWPHQSKEAL
jgi:hypothetical protein